MITDTYDANVTFVSANPPPDAGTDDTWTIGNLPASGSGSIIITVEVKSPLPDGTVLDNLVEIDCDQEVSDSATEDTTVGSLLILTADAGGPSYEGTAGVPLSLSGSASGGIPPYTYNWDLDYNGSYETPGKNVIHTWDTAGDYTVGLEVTDSSGVIATDTAEVHINPPAVTAVGGEAYPPNKLAILTPWIALALFLALGGGLLLMRRRQA